MSAFSGRDGFVATEAGPAAHFGSPVGEQRALASGRAVVELGLGVVTVSGPDRLSWLNSITSQLLTGLEPGVSTETLVLDQSGRVEHAARVVDDGEITWLLTEPADAAPLAAWLDSMRFMLRVEVTTGRPTSSRSAASRVRQRPTAWSSSGSTRGRRSRPVDGATPPGGPSRLRLDPPHRRRHPGRRGCAGSVGHAGRGAARVRGPAHRRVAALARGRRRADDPRTSSTGSAPPCTCRRVATAGRRPSPRCTTSGTRRRAAW